ncbi:YjgN family protein [Parvularcula lutaonensis]|uniref:YjgN family protein n=1 Tax=Parvularcula lutaonensis TaxID=491923 RepID=A0ABV7MEQ0_9PROT|nr:YjgN family protein [Parvularcula lutaonensis]GGY52110.1 membrane protein [Parvularcula lutaonensis]
MDTQTPAEQPQALPFTFHGKAGEFFGIWIVNLLLSVVTLGVYSAWAKVRTNRYFYGSTRLDGDAFSYHARPLQILIARIIVVSVLIIFNLVISIEPMIGLAVLPVFFFLFPWLIGRSLRFQARVSRWRGISFDFDTAYWPTFVTIYIVPLITIFSFGLGAPVATKLTWEWYLGRHSFGDRPFTSEISLGKLYGLFGVLFVVGFLAFGGLALVLAVSGIVDRLSASAAGDFAAFGALLVIYSFVILLAILQLVWTAGVRNIAFETLVLDGKHHFRSTISKRRYAWIVVSNLIVTVLTFGLMTPWAAVRLARYIASATAVLPGGPLDDFVQDVKETSGVIGEEYVDLEGIDIGVGL